MKLLNMLDKDMTIDVPFPSKGKIYIAPEPWIDDADRIVEPRGNVILRWLHAHALAGWWLALWGAIALYAQSNYYREQLFMQAVELQQATLHISAHHVAIAGGNK